MYIAKYTLSYPVYIYTHTYTHSFYSCTYLYHFLRTHQLEYIGEYTISQDKIIDALTVCVISVLPYDKIIAFICARC